MPVGCCAPGETGSTVTPPKPARFFASSICRTISSELNRPFRCQKGTGRYSAPGIDESRPQRVGGLGPGQQQRRRDENQCMSESRHIRFGSIRSSVRAKRFVTFPASERSGPPRDNRNLSSRPETGNVFSRCHKNSENIVGDQPVRRHFTSETGRTFSIPFSCPPEGTESVRRPARRLKPEKISGSRLRIAAQIGSNGRKRAPDFARRPARSACYRPLKSQIQQNVFRRCELRVDGENVDARDYRIPHERNPHEKCRSPARRTALYFRTPPTGAFPYTCRSAS